MKFDYVCIGAGIASLMFSYRIRQRYPDASVAILEKGKRLEERSCPLDNRTVSRCIHCKQCAIVSGVAGSGAKNDGKYIIPTVDSADYGGWLAEYIGAEPLIDLVKQLDGTLTGFADKEYPFYSPSFEFKAECLKYDLHLKTAYIRHYGSDGNFRVMSKLVEYLEREGVNIFTEVGIKDIDLSKKEITSTAGSFEYNKLVIAVGRNGTPWFVDFCRLNRIELESNKVDIGVRVEIPSAICKQVSETMYEPKIYYRTKQYGDIVRSFCWNNNDAKVCIENNDKVLSVNGYSNSSSNELSGNSNFALLASINFSQPFKQPTEYARYIASLSNMISGNSVLVQRLGDLKLGRRTNEHRLSQSTTIPTLKTAVAGDISLAMPKRILDDIIETLDAMNNVMMGISNYDTLLYSPEIKTYSAKPKFISENFDISEDVYCCGDCSGTTRSLSQAGAQGLYIADRI